MYYVTAILKDLNNNRWTFTIKSTNGDYVYNYLTLTDALTARYAAMTLIDVINRQVKAA